MSVGPANRSDAERRRGLLQLRLKRRDWSRTFRQVAPTLCRHGVRFAKLAPARSPTLLQHVYDAPGRDERIDWPQVDAGQCARWESPGECRALILAALEACTAGAERIGIVFHPVEAGIILNGASVGAAWPLLHDHLHETIWLVSMEQRGWAIEVSYVDHEVCFARSLSARST